MNRRGWSASAGVEGGLQCVTLDLLRRNDENVGAGDKIQRDENQLIRPVNERLGGQKISKINQSTRLGRAKINYIIQSAL